MMYFVAKSSSSVISLVCPKCLPIRHASTLSLNPLKWFQSNQTSKETAVAIQPQSAEVASHEEDLLMSIDEHTNKFIPVTRGTLLKTLVMQKGLFTATERHLMEDFAAALDSHYSQKFYGVMEESKVLKNAVCRELVLASNFKSWKPVRLNLKMFKYFINQKRIVGIKLYSLTLPLKVCSQYT